MTDSERDEKYAKILARMVRCETVSSIEDGDREKFRAFHSLLEELFPTVFAKSEKFDFDGSLLLHIKGKTDKMPIMLMSHLDVVEPNGEWLYPPFSGEIAEGKIWGRGTLDTKSSLFAIFQALEELLLEGYIPECDVYIESACTEETSGSGADAISKKLQADGVRFSVVYDEGGYVLHDPLGVADHDFAFVGVGEKGTADIKFRAKSSGGHTSMPGKNTPLVRLGKFMAEAEKHKIFDLKMNSVTEELFRRSADYMSGAKKFLFKNVAFFRPLLTLILPKISNAAAAMLRTTIAFTMAGGSDGTNVLPSEGWVIGNMRFSHHQGQKVSFEKITALAKKYDIETEILDPGFESAISDFNSAEFKKLEKTVGLLWKDVPTAPYVMNGASDCRYFSRVCDNCFRFSPYKISDEQLESIHGINENINIEGIHKAVDFYKFIIKEA